MTMYGEPFCSVPTSMMRATCSDLRRTAARASHARKLRDGLLVRQRRGAHELQRDELLELEVGPCRDDHTHAAGRQARVRPARYL